MMKHIRIESVIEELERLLTPIPPPITLNTT